MTKGCEKSSVKKKEKRRKKLAKSKTRKGGLSQKWASRWIENPKGRSRQKLGAYKNILPVDWKPERAIQAKVRDLKKKQYKNDDKKKKTKTEASQFKWAEWGNTPLVYRWRLLPMVRWMATSVYGSIDGDFWLWFD